VADPVANIVVWRLDRRAGHPADRSVPQLAEQLLLLL